MAKEALKDCNPVILLNIYTELITQVNAYHQTFGRPHGHLSIDSFVVLVDERALHNFKVLLLPPLELVLDHDPTNFSSHNKEEHDVVGGGCTVEGDWVNTGRVLFDFLTPTTYLELTRVVDSSYTKAQIAQKGGRSQVFIEVSVSQVTYNSAYLRAVKANKNSTEPAK